MLIRLRGETVKKKINKIQRAVTGDAVDGPFGEF